jgi:hypothetical protein
LTWYSVGEKEGDDPQEKLGPFPALAVPLMQLPLKSLLRARRAYRLRPLPPLQVKPEKSSLSYRETLPVLRSEKSQPDCFRDVHWLSVFAGHENAGAERKPNFTLVRTSRKVHQVTYCRSLLRKEAGNEGGGNSLHGNDGNGSMQRASEREKRLIVQSK